MEYEDKIRNAKYWSAYYKSGIAIVENKIIRGEQALGGRGESSIIRYY